MLRFHWLNSQISSLGAQWYKHYNVLVFLGNKSFFIEYLRILLYDDAMGITIMNELTKIF